MENTAALEGGLKNERTLPSRGAEKRDKSNRPFRSKKGRVFSLLESQGKKRKLSPRRWSAIAAPQSNSARR